MKNRIITLTAAAAIAASVLAGCGGGEAATSDVVVGTAEADAGTEPVAAVVQSEAVETTSDANVDTHGDGDDFAYNDSDVVTIDLDNLVATSGVTVDGTSVIVTSGGTYELSGELADGELIVEAGDAEVQLILDGVDITNSTGAAIAVMSAGQVTVILADGSANSLTDGSTYVLADGEDEPNAALYSKADLSIGGEGTLAVTGNYNDGITSKDGLVIDGGTVVVIAVDDGIRGKDYVVVEDGALEISAGGDGIKADNEEDADKGFISISGGALDIDAGGDGVQAATDVIITGGEFDITTGGGSAASLGADASAKAVKGAVSVVIEGGSFAIDSADDAIHSNESVVINNGSFEIRTGDDAVHADNTVEVNGGSITVTESYEGIEGTIVTINGGDIDIVASDDGLNVAGGVDGSGTLNAAGAPSEDGFRTRPGGGPGGGGTVGEAGGGTPPVETPGEYYLYINGGVISIDAYGDGIDSNGYVVMTGGTVIIDGSTSSRDSALDHNGTFEMNGGTLIGTNIDGMMSEGINAGTQAAIYFTTSSAISGGEVVHIAGADGAAIATFETTNDFSVVVFSSPDLVAGETYEVSIGGTAGGADTYGLYAADAYSAGTTIGAITAG